MQFGAKTRRPRQSCVFGIDECGTISRYRVIGLIGLNPEAPDIALPRTVRIGIIDLINSPVVSLAVNKTVRIWISGKAGNKIQAFLITAECFALTCGIVHIVKIVAHIHIM